MRALSCRSWLLTSSTVWVRRRLSIYRTSGGLLKKSFMVAVSNAALITLCPLIRPIEEYPSMRASRYVSFYPRACVVPVPNATTSSGARAPPGGPPRRCHLRFHHHRRNGR